MPPSTNQSRTERVQMTSLYQRSKATQHHRLQIRALASALHQHLRQLACVQVNSIAHRLTGSEIGKWEIGHALGYLKVRAWETRKMWAELALHRIAAIGGALGGHESGVQGMFTATPRHDEVPNGSRGAALPGEPAPARVSSFIVAKLLRAEYIALAMPPPVVASASDGVARLSMLESTARSASELSIVGLPPAS